MKKPEPARSRIQASGNDEDPVQEDDDGGEGGGAGEGADVPDAAHDDRRREAAEHEAGRPAGADQTELGGGEALGRAAERQEQRCIPFAASRNAVERSSARTGTI